jgi:hypothetical protein
MVIYKALSLHQKRGVGLEIIGVILCDIIILWRFSENGFIINPIKCE